METPSEKYSYLKQGLKICSSHLCVIQFSRRKFLQWKIHKLMHLPLPVFNLWVIKHNLTCNFPFLSYELKGFYPLTFFEIMERETHKISTRVCPLADIAPVYSAKIGWSTVGMHG